MGEFILDGLVEGARGEAKVKVTFNIDSNGIVDVVATASGTGSTKQMRVESSSNLSRGEVDALRFTGEDATAAGGPELTDEDDDLDLELDDVLEDADDDLAADDMLEASDADDWTEDEDDIFFDEDEVTSK